MEVVYYTGRRLMKRSRALVDSGAPESEQAALLLAVSTSDGTELAQHQLDASPVFDGMAAASGRLYISLENGHLVCMEGD